MTETSGWTFEMRLICRKWNYRWEFVGAAWDCSGWSLSCWNYTPIQPRFHTRSHK
jgi:hypothetical protein